MLPLQVGELTQELKELPKRALLAAAFITYMSAASEVRHPPARRAATRRTHSNN